MGTKNFYVESASEDFGVYTTYSSKGQVMSDIRRMLEDKGYIDKNRAILYPDHRIARNFPSEVVCSKVVETQYNAQHRTIRNIEVVMTIDVVIRSGYYDGYNLDYIVHFELGSTDIGYVPDKEELKDILLQEGILYHIVHRTVGNMHKHISKVLKEEIDVLEDVFSKITELYPNESE